MVPIITSLCLATVLPTSESGSAAHANWMGDLMPAIGNLTLLDLSLPGTHDSMTFDLSTRVSDGANDMPAWVSWLLHEMGPIIGVAKVGDFIKQQAQTQSLNMTMQLEHGARFIDFRTMYTAAPTKGSIAAHDWYGLHMVETNTKSLQYLADAKAFLEAHPSEVLVLWISRHGSQCAMGNDQYPNIKPDTKQAFWQQIEALFGPMLFNTTARSLNTTSLAELVESGQRVVIYAADYAEFTANSSLAYDSCARLSNNLHGGDITDMNATINGLDAAFRGAAAKRADLKRQNSFYLMSMAGSPPGSVTTAAAEIDYLPFGKDKKRQKCAASLNIPNLTDWCPLTLLEAELLRNYYTQRALDKTADAESGLALPGAIYIDVLDINGTIRTGTQLFSDGSAPSGTTGFAYVDTLLLYNARVGCAAPAASSECNALLDQIMQRRAQHPMRKWDDPAHGRLADWP